MDEKVDHSDFQNSLKDIPEFKLKDILSELRFWMKNTLVEEAEDPIDNGKSVATVVRKMIIANPDKWWAGHHFFWGMQVRNKLRSWGFGEKELAVGNLDDYWVSLVEEALNEEN